MINNYERRFVSSLFTFLIALIFITSCTKKSIDIFIPPPVPGAIADLTATPAINEISLFWTAPELNDDSVQAHFYDLRYATYPITDSNWNSASKWSDSINAQPPGEEESIVVTGLLMDSTYYFAIKSSDSSLNWSDISNISSASPLNLKLILELRQELGIFELFAVNIDGSGLVNLTNNFSQNRYPDWSPDGNQIVYASNVDGDFDIYVMNADGSNVRQLTTDPRIDMWPVWSPDGSQIAFTSTRDNNTEIYIIDADGSNLTRVTDSPGPDAIPIWLSDGSGLVFKYGYMWDFYKIDIDGNNRELIVEFGDAILMMDLSSDNSMITFAGGDVDYPDVYVVDIAAKTLTQLTNTPAKEYHPTFSPDGSRILFSTIRDGNWELYSMNPEGSDLINISNNQYHDNYPSWTTDGSKIIFKSTRDGQGDVYIMNPDGTNVQRLTAAAYHTLSITCSPVLSE